MTKPGDKLDLTLQADILQLGQLLAERRRGAGRGINQQPQPDELEAEVQRVLGLVKKSSARQLFGISQGRVSDTDAIHLKAVAIMAWGTIGEGGLCTRLDHIAGMIADPRKPYCGELLLVRDALGRMVCDNLLLLSRSHIEGDCWKGEFLLPRHTFAWLAGGSQSKGTFHHATLNTLSLPDSHQDGTTSGRKAIPTAQQLYDTVRQQVIGLDPQLKVLSSRLALHLVRAEALRKGVDDQAVGQMVVCLIGSSGSGKSYVVGRLAACCGLPFCQYDCTALTSQGYVGADLDEPYRLLTIAAGGDLQEASRGVIFLDEFDKKAAGARDVCTQAVQQELLGKLQTNAPFVVGGKRSFDARSYLFDGRPTGYVLGGVFSGLDEILQKKADHRGIGFSVTKGGRNDVYIQGALKELGFLDELVNRISCVVRLPDPTAGNISHAVVSSLMEGFNQVLAPSGIFVMPTQAAAVAIGRYGVDSKTFYRGAKAILATIAEEMIFSPSKETTCLIDRRDVLKAIDRLASGCVQSGEPHSAGNDSASPCVDLSDANGRETVAC
jgi:ATP-dependent Clp protease ATP-binding subunit ClpX